MDEMFQKDSMKYALKKKYYAKLYRLSLIEKKGFHYRSAELAAEIKKMEQLQGQYLFLCRNNVESVTDLIEINVKNKQRIDLIASRQHAIYMERSDKKRKCKTPQDLREYQLWYMESQQELDQLKTEKKELRRRIRMGQSCINENLKTAEYKVSKSEDLQYDEKDEIPSFLNIEKKDDKHSVIEGVVLYAQPEINSEKIKTPMIENVSEVEKKQKPIISERVEKICDEIMKSDKAYDSLLFEEKTELFQFEFDDITENLKLHKEVLSKLGMKYSGAEMFEDYQGIYDETVKQEERGGGFEKVISSVKEKGIGRNR